MDSVSFECTPFSHLYSINTNAATIHSSTSSTLSPVITTTTSTSTNSISNTANSRVAEVAAANYSLRWLFESEIARKVSGLSFIQTFFLSLLFVFSRFDLSLSAHQQGTRPVYSPLLVLI